MNSSKILLNLVCKKKIEDLSKNKMPFTVYGNPEIIEERPNKFPKSFNSFRITSGKYILLNKTITIPESGTFTIIFWVKSYNSSGSWAFIFTPHSYYFPIMSIRSSTNTGFVYEPGANYEGKSNINGDNKWHQLCMTKDSSGTIRYFVDGNLEVSTTNRNYEQHIDMNIGGTPYSQGYFDCANGFITTECLYTENFSPKIFVNDYKYLYSNIKID